MNIIKCEDTLKVIQISIETITRVFNLSSVDPEIKIDYLAFEKHRDATNKMIFEGMKYKDELFEDENLISVKKFYSHLTKNTLIKKYFTSLGIRERLVRCSAQYAYFAVRNSKHQRDLCKIIAKELSKTSTWTEYQRKHWKYFDFSNRESNKMRDRLNSSIVSKILTSYSNSYPNRYSVVSNTTVQNFYLHIKKILFKELEGIEADLQLPFTETKNSILQHYNKEFLDLLIKRYCTQVSSILTKQFKKFKKETNSFYKIFINFW